MEDPDFIKFVEYQNYYNELNNIWDKIEKNTFSSKDLMDEYDKNFRLCLEEKEEMVYMMILYFLYKKAEHPCNKILYENVAGVMLRTSSYLNRFWIVKNQKTDVYTEALNIWKKFHP
jgi:hypothetical protein